MRRLAIGLAACVILIVAALAIAPRLIDWNNYRSEVTARLRDATGLRWVINGPIRLVLLPSPALRLSDVAVVAPAGGAARPDLLQARSIAVRLSLAAALGGTVEARDLDLDRPVLTIERLPTGRFDWLDAITPRPGAGTPATLPSSLRIDRLTIAHGTILYRDGKRRLRIDGLAATAALASIDGPFRIAGHFVRRGRAMSFATSGGPLAAGSLPLQLSLEAESSGAGLRFQGDVGRGASGLAASGTLHLDGRSLAAASRDLSPVAPPLPALPFSLSGRLAVDALGARLTRAEASLGKTQATGAAQIVFAAPLRFALWIIAPQLDLDAIGQQDTGLAAWLAAPAADWKGEVMAQISAAIWRGKVIRRVRATLGFAQGRISVAGVSGLLPGGGEAVLRSTLLVGAAPQATGTVSITADNLRQLLAWLGAAVAGMPPDALRTAALTAHFTASPTRIALGPLDLDLDATHLAGAAAIALSPHPGLDAQIKANIVDLDAYLPRGAPLARLRWLAAAAGGWGGVKLDAAIDTLIIAGRPFRAVRLLASAQPGSLTIRDAELQDLSGAAARFAGHITNLGAPMPTVSGGIQVTGPDLAPLLRWAAAGWRRTGSPQPFAFDATVATAKGRLTGKVLLSLPGNPALAAAPAPLSLKAGFSGDAAGLALDPLALALGSQELTGRASLTLTAGPRLDLTLQGGDISLDQLVPSDQGAAMLPAAMAAGASLLGIPLSPSGVDADLALAADQVSYGRLVFGKPRLRIALHGARVAADLAAGVLGGALDGSLAYARAAAPDSLPQLTATLRCKSCALGTLLKDAAGDSVITGAADADVTLAAAGSDLRQLADSLAGSAAIRARRGAVTGIDLAAIAGALDRAAKPPTAAALNRALKGATPFTDLTAAFALSGGVARSGDVSLDLPGGGATGSFALDLPEGRLSSVTRLRLDGFPEAPPITLRLSGPIAGPSRSFDLAPLAAYAKAGPPRTR